MAKIPLPTMLKLASFLKARDVAGRDNGDGGMEIDDPFGSGKIIVRDARIFGHLPIVKGPRPVVDYVSKLTEGAAPTEIKKYKITQEEYTAALCSVIDRDALRPTPKELQLPNLEALSGLKETDPELYYALELNTRFGKVDMDGQVVIFDLTTGTSYRKDDFMLWLSAEKVTVTVKKKTNHGTESRLRNSSLLRTGSNIQPICGSMALACILKVAIGMDGHTLTILIPRTVITYGVATTSNRGKEIGTG